MSYDILLYIIVMKPYGAAAVSDVNIPMDLPQTTPFYSPQVPPRPREPWNEMYVFSVGSAG